MSTVMQAGGFVPRYNAVERTTHWTVAIAFVIATVSGLALFHPAFWGLSALLGGGVWTRILHPWAGLIMVIAFVPMVLWYWRDNLIRPYDTAWARRLPDVLMNRDEGIPEIDKYNIGQKLLFWTVTAMLLLLVASGLVLWFDTDLRLPIPLVRVSGFVHAFSAFVLFVGMIVHIYSAVFWIRGSTRAMLRGVVTVNWAKHHHPLWARRVTGARK
jgi:formate dehydrogenase subunit gamma